MVQLRRNIQILRDIKKLELVYNHINKFKLFPEERVILKFEIEEKNIEKVTAFSACGLGFAAYVLNAFQKAGQAFGFSAEISEKIVAKTFGNAIDMSDYEGTASAVATKGVATEQGIICFEKNNLNGIVSEAINDAYNKMK